MFLKLIKIGIRVWTYDKVFKMSKMVDDKLPCTIQIHKKIIIVIIL